MNVTLPPPGPLRERGDQYTLRPLDLIQNKSTVKMRARLTGRDRVAGVMRNVQAVLLATVLCLTVLPSAAAQQQVRFERWAAPFSTVEWGGPASPSVTDSVRRKVGYHHWKGAAIGAGVGAVVGTVFAFGVAGRCADCTVTTGDRAQAALVVTGISTAFGFLVGLASPKYGWEVRAEAPGTEQ